MTTVALPGAMLARSGALPTRDDFAFEVKWDGFRALVSTEDGLRVRSRRRWDMTPLLPELEALPAGLVLDGELVVFGEDGLPSFPLLCARLLHRTALHPVVYMLFDVLRVEGEDAMSLPYRERRALLEALDLRGRSWHAPESFQDGEALFAVVCERGLEGVVAKRLSGRYRPGERDWLKIKNRGYWRYGQELEAARQKTTRARALV